MGGIGGIGGWSVHKWDRWVGGWVGWLQLEGVRWGEMGGGGVFLGGEGGGVSWIGLDWMRVEE